ncbi:MAG: hypothetical protein CMI21_12915 [Opitutae bacterium]|nr:hypothetical protein [Opitutae bacterium]
MTVTRGGDSVVTSCSVGNAQEIIRHHLDSIAKDPDCSNNLPPIMLWGPPGIGKSTIIREITEEMGIGFIDVRLAQREPVDIRGLPVPREDRSGVDWMVSSEWPRTGQEGTPERGVILFDELTAADASLQVAAYEFILDRRLGTLYEVPEGWYIVAAGNRTKDSAVARTMSSALANRFCHLELEANEGAWVNWAISREIEPSVIAFIRYRPDLLLNMSGNRERGWPSPRSWERVSTEIGLARGTSLSPKSLDLVIEGLVGAGAALEFNAFRSWTGSMPDVEKMLLEEVPPEFPKRSDLQYATVSAIAHYFSTSEDRSMLMNGLFGLLMAMPVEWSQMAWTDIELFLSNRYRSTDPIEELHTHSKYQEFADKLLGSS